MALFFRVGSAVETGLPPVGSSFVVRNGGSSASSDRTPDTTKSVSSATALQQTPAKTPAAAAAAASAAASPTVKAVVQGFLYGATDSSGKTWKRAYFTIVARTQAQQERALRVAGKEDSKSKRRAAEKTSKKKKKTTNLAAADLPRSAGSAAVSGKSAEDVAEWYVEDYGSQKTPVSQKQLDEGRWVRQLRLTGGSAHAYGYGLFPRIENAYQFNICSAEGQKWILEAPHHEYRKKWLEVLAAVGVPLKGVLRYGATLKESYGLMMAKKKAKANGWKLRYLYLDESRRILHWANSRDEALRGKFRGGIQLSGNSQIRILPEAEGFKQPHAFSVTSPTASNRKPREAQTFLFAAGTPHGAQEWVQSLRHSAQLATQ